MGKGQGKSSLGKSSRIPIIDYEQGDSLVAQTTPTVFKCRKNALPASHSSLKNSKNGDDGPCPNAPRFACFKEEAEDDDDDDDDEQEASELDRESFP